MNLLSCYIVIDIGAQYGEGDVMESLSDESLLARVLVGDPQALTLLVTRHHSLLLGYLDRLVGPDWALAQDLAQETFLRVLQQSTDRGEKPFLPWLYTIATNLARNHFASAYVRHTIPFLDGHRDLVTDTTADPEALFLTLEQREHLVSLLRQLSFLHRETLLLRFWSGLSLQEIATIQGVPVGTVKSRLCIGLRRLRALLQAHEQEGT
jgi:RNA polymerase sigma-70 factor (ECF subfamily)